MIMSVSKTISPIECDITWTNYIAMIMNFGFKLERLLSFRLNVYRYPYAY